jgi:carbamoyltransferase
VLSGGCAQNTLCNEQLSQVYRSLHIPPHCYDGGISLGCLEFLRLYYGQKPFSNQGFPYWQTDEHPGEVSDGVIHQVARLLAEGKIVGWFQGHGEIGPRALGHRSILIDPRLQNAKDVLNQRVKHREHWRPYAPSVLARYAETWFDLDRPSPYMLRAVRGREGYRDQIPAVIHEDGTSRVQTVEDATAGEQSPFSRLLGSFHEQTGIPLLLNTSLNAGGSPIFSTPQQCLELFQATDLDAMCIGDTLLVK